MPSPFTGTGVGMDLSTHVNNLAATSGTTALAVATVVQAFAAPTASGCRNYVTGIQVVNTAVAVATTFSILDGASTVIWSIFLPLVPATLQPVPIFFPFMTPLKCTVGNVTNVQCGTTSAAVFWNLQGYSGPY